MALYVWDYFYITNVPAHGDEKAWRAIECATCRIRESECYLEPPFPADIRLRSARRMRQAARVARRNIERLAVPPARWVIDALVDLEGHADDMLKALCLPGRQIVVH